MLLHRIFHVLLSLFGCISKNEQEMLFEDYEVTIMNFPSNRPQSQTVPPPQVYNLSRWERPTEVCGYRKAVSGWEPADDRFSRRFAFILLPAVGKKHWTLLKSWQRTTWARGTNAIFWALRFLGRNLWYLELPECEWGHEIILVFIFIILRTCLVLFCS